MSARRMVAVAAVVGLSVAGCSAADGPATDSEAVSVHDTWVKAVDDGMTAGFGHFMNDSGEDVRIVSASTPAAPRVELHEVVPDSAGASKMQVKPGGFVIPRDGDLELAPSADHLMLMDVTEALVPGSDVDIVVTFEDGSTLPIAAQVRDFPGADEHYDPGTHG